MSEREFLIGTRGSPLALAQANLVIDALGRAWPGRRFAVRTISTRGDRDRSTPLAALAGQGVFTSEIQARLRAGAIDLAVHSLKDLPSVEPADLVLGAIPEREDPRDVLVSRTGARLLELPSGARVGTSGPRRQAELRHRRPELEIAEIRGNVDTRLRKVDDGEYDATILAAAGLKRLGRADRVTEYLDPLDWVPAVGQAALAVECRAGDAELLELLAAIDHAPSRQAVSAERAFLAALGAGCKVAAGAHAYFVGDRLRLVAVLATRDGRDRIQDEADEVSDVSPMRGRRGQDRAAELGRGLLERMLGNGGATIVERERSA